jgi:hypothetical protein
LRTGFLGEYLEGSNWGGSGIIRNLFTKYYYSEQIREKVVSKIYRMHGRDNKCIHSFGQKIQRRDRPLEKYIILIIRMNITSSS